MITPIEEYPELAKVLNINQIFFKREDLHPYGSHKGRSIPYMIDFYYGKGDRNFVITGSGNAALAAAMHIRKLNSNLARRGLACLDIFVGNNISPFKLAKIRELTGENIRVLIKERPLQALSQMSLEGARSLRQSTDDTALIGYKTLAEELVTTPNIGSVFIGTSSGTTAQALADYLNKNKFPIQVHIIQTSSCHVMSDAFDTFSGPEEQSISDAIVDQTAQRKPTLIPILEKSGGRGWFATNEAILAAQELTKKYTGLDISTNSALSVVGVMQAVYAGYELKGSVVCLICGK